VGVPATTRHAGAAPGRLGSIPARLARRRLEGTGPGTPHPTRRLSRQSVSRALARSPSA